VKRLFSTILAGVLFVSGCSKTKYEPEKYSADLVKRAEAGNAPAQFSLGLCYQEGEGVAKNEKEAISWYSKSAEQGNPLAQLKLARIHDHEFGFEPRDMSKAFSFYQKAAQQNNPEAQARLGHCYANGEGVQKDEKEAFKWFRRSAEQGYPPGQQGLGLCYERGRGVSKDEAEAEKWYKLASVAIINDNSSLEEFLASLGAEQGLERLAEKKQFILCLKSAEKGDASAQAKLGRYYELGEGTDKNNKEALKWYVLSTEQENAEAYCYLGELYQKGIEVTKDEAKAADMFLKAASKGNALGQLLLGVCYQNGSGVFKNPVEGVKWFTEAANQGYAEAQTCLGIAYLNGEGVRKDQKKAFDLFKNAADQGNGKAQYLLGRAYENGIGVEKNTIESVKWYSKSADQGNAEAEAKLGNFYLKGFGVERSVKKAVALYTKAAEKGDQEAQYCLGSLFIDGREVPADFVEGTKWLRMSAEQGNPQAQFELGTAYASGDGVNKRENEAIEYFTMAAEKNNAKAQCELARRYLYGLGVKKNETEAARWANKSAAQNNPTAQSLLGMMYMKGSGVTKGKEESLSWFKKAAENGSRVAQKILGRIYYEGNEMQRSESLMRNNPSLELARKLALGTAIDNDECLVDRDLIESFRWYKKAAENGDPESQYRIGWFYQKGEGPQKDVNEAFRWFTKSAEQGYADAAGMLSAYYQDGVSVIKDHNMALLWSYIAIAMGDDATSTSTLNQKLEKELGPNVSAQIRERAKQKLSQIRGKENTHEEAVEVKSDQSAEKSASPKRYGTGFVITGDGIIATAAHVVEDGRRVEVLVKDKKLKAKVVKIDSQNDLALLKCEGLNIAPLPILESGRVRVGQTVFTVGFPNIELQGLSPKMTKGDISSTSGALDTPTCWQISVPVQTGNSGGPLLDQSGNVVGVVVSRLNFAKDAKGNQIPTQNVNYAVKSAYLLPLVQELGVKTPSARGKTPFSVFESVVEDSGESVVMVLAY
jgi:TPR repeat protein